MAKIVNLVRLCKSIWQHPANRDQKFKALFNSLAWQAGKQISAQDKVIDYHGLNFICFTDSHSSSAVVYFGGQPDYSEMQFMKAYLKPGDGYLDIGANIGIYSLFAASLIERTGHIDAFEASVQTADKLQKQFAINALENTNLHCVAVADKNGELTFDLTGDDCTAHISVGKNSPGTQETVRSVKLDDYLDPDTDYAMGKMDIEGAEILALKGAQDRLARANPPVWQLELAGYSNRYGYRSDQVLDYLKTFDFHCAVYDSAVKKVVFTDKPWANGYQNVLAIHPSARHIDSA